jgi:hypothetical protein
MIRRRQKKSKNDVVSPPFPTTSTNSKSRLVRRGEWRFPLYIPSMTFFVADINDKKYLTKKRYYVQTSYVCIRDQSVQEIYTVLERGAEKNVDNQKKLE